MNKKQLEDNLEKVNAEIEESEAKEYEYSVDEEGKRKKSFFIVNPKR